MLQSSGCASCLPDVDCESLRWNGSSSFYNELIRKEEAGSSGKVVDTLRRSLRSRRAREGYRRYSSQTLPHSRVQDWYPRFDPLYQLTLRETPQRDGRFRTLT